MRITRVLLAGAALVLRAGAQEQYPTPLIHTPTNHPAARVVLINVEGLHAYDLARWVAEHPQSALAELSARGVTYTNAHTPAADPVAGLAAIVTGGSAISTGIVRGDGYDRGLSAAGSECKKTGAAIAIHGGVEAAGLALDPKHGCAPVMPHALLRVNDIFEVVHEKIGKTAWVGEDAATIDLLRGPSGAGLDDTCVFAGDRARIEALVRMIDGKDCAGRSDAAVPFLFGTSLSEFSVAQGSQGYGDAVGTPSAGLAKSLAETDAGVGRVVAELKAKKLDESTWIFVTAGYGQVPIAASRRRHTIAELKAAVDSVRPGLALHVSGGDAAMVWLGDAAMTDRVVKALAARGAALGIEEIYSGAKLGLLFNAASNDARMPDVMLQGAPGVAWGGDGLAAHGGVKDEDTHVALLVSGKGLGGRLDKTWVPTTQLAPLLLRALGMEKFDLQALHQEHSPALPGIF